MKFKIKKNENKIYYPPKSQQKLLFETYKLIDSGVLKRPYRFHSHEFTNMDILEEYQVLGIPVRIAKKGGEGLYLIHESMISPQKEAVVSYAYNSLIHSLSYEDFENIKLDRLNAEDIIKSTLKKSGEMLGIGLNYDDLRNLTY
jgi:hypothetical protein